MWWWNTMADNDERPSKELQTRRTAAEQLVADHENRVSRPKQSADKMETVRQHNRCTPRLDEELDKKRSVTKITTIKADSVDKEFDVRCTACAQIAVYNALKKLQLKSKCSTHKQTKTRRKCTRCPKCQSKGGKSQDRRNNHNLKPKEIKKLSGVAKNEKTQKTKSIYKFCTRNPGCHCSLSSIDTNNTSDYSIVTTKKDKHAKNTKDSQEKARNCEKSTTKTDSKVILKPTGSEWLKMRPTESEWLKMHPTASQWQDLRPTSSQWFDYNSEMPSHSRSVRL